MSSQIAEILEELDSLKKRVHDLEQIPLGKLDQIPRDLDRNCLKDLLEVTTISTPGDKHE